MHDHVKFIGLGQCGYRITKKFADMGYAAAYINSDEVDARGAAAEIKDDTMLVLQGTGTGKSVKKGKEILEKNRSKFNEFLKANAHPTGITVLVAGAGGGTGGSFVGSATEYLLEIDKKVGVIMTLPPSMLGIIPAENALKTLQEVTRLNTRFLFLADNEMLMKEKGLGESWWSRVNDEIVNQFIAAVDVTKTNKSADAGIGSIDFGELMRVLTYGKGLTDIRKVNIPLKDLSERRDKLAIAQKLPEGATPPEMYNLARELFDYQLVKGYDYKTSLAFLVCIDIPSKVNYNFTDDAREILELAKRKFGDGIAVYGMFTDSTLRDTIRVTMINSGLQMPKILQQRIAQLKKSEEKFVEKTNKQDLVGDEIKGFIGSDILSDDLDF